MIGEFEQMLICPYCDKENHIVVAVFNHHSNGDGFYVSEHEFCDYCNEKFNIELRLEPEFEIWRKE